MNPPKLKRVLLKLSGQALAGAAGYGIDRAAVEHIVGEILKVHSLGVQIAIVVGGGNIFRGNLAAEWSIDRVEADNVGMLGTLINGILLRQAIMKRHKGDVRLMSAIDASEIAEPYVRAKAERHLSRGSIMIFAGGIGQPFVTTDYPAVQRAVELRCDALLAAKNGIDGVFNADPLRDPSAELYRFLSIDEVIREGLKFMDLTAMVLAREHQLPIHAFNFDRVGAMRGICEGESIGTLVSSEVKSEFAKDGAGQ
jgi:uridylate kinase